MISVPKDLKQHKTPNKKIQIRHLHFQNFNSFQHVKIPDKLNKFFINFNVIKHDVHRLCVECLSKINFSDESHKFSR